MVERRFFKGMERGFFKSMERRIFKSMERGFSRIWRIYADSFVLLLCLAPSVPLCLCVKKSFN
ncbi:MAG: hypothetical protein FWG87_00510 [Defluviitaleaceae bacterium]|nr:hypothetical protein [Defluviitaleaceae bacterium]